MRILLKAEMPTENGNASIKDGTLQKKMQSIIEDQQPEAIYFSAENGKRTAYSFLNIDDPAQIPEVCEPWFLAFNANIEITPAMVPDDLMRAAPAFEQAVMKYSK